MVHPNCQHEVTESAFASAQLPNNLSEGRLSTDFDFSINLGTWHWRPSIACFQSACQPVPPSPHTCPRGLETVLTSRVILLPHLCAHQKTRPVLQDTSQMPPTSSMRTSSEPLEQDKLSLLLEPQEHFVHTCPQALTTVCYVPSYM